MEKCNGKVFIEDSADIDKTLLKEALSHALNIPDFLVFTKFFESIGLKKFRRMVVRYFYSLLDKVCSVSYIFRSHYDNAI